MSLLPDVPTLTLVILMLIAASIAHTVFHVLQLSLADDLCANSEERASLFALSGVITILLTLVGTAGAPMLIKYFGGGRVGYSAMAGCTALAAVSTFPSASCHNLSSLRAFCNSASNCKLPAVCASDL